MVCMSHQEWSTSANPSQLAQEVRRMVVQIQSTIMQHKAGKTCSGQFSYKPESFLVPLSHASWRAKGAKVIVVSTLKSTCYKLVEPRFLVRVVKPSENAKPALSPPNLQEPSTFSWFQLGNCQCRPMDTFSCSWGTITLLRFQEFASNDSVPDEKKMCLSLIRSREFLLYFKFWSL